MEIPFRTVVAAVEEGRVIFENIRIGKQISNYRHRSLVAQKSQS